MFFRYAFLISLIPILYVYLRVFSVFTSRAQKIIFTVVFMILVLAFPATEMLSHSESPFSTRWLLSLGYCSLPFLLYAFLVVLLLDILRGLNRLLKIVPREVIEGRRARAAILSLLIAIPTIVVIIGRARLSDITVNEYLVRVPQRASHLDHLRIALASDFHLKEMTDEHFMRRFVAKVNSLDADLLLIPGDVLEGDRQDGQLGEFERQFREVRTRYGVYASLGNHESHGRGGTTDFFQKSNMTVLSDTTVLIGNAFTVVGRNDAHLKERKPIDELMRSAADSLPSIVLDHRPTDLQQIGATHADISVSGHTHNGQLFPFNYITGQIYDLSWGYKKIRNTHAFVTSGVQVWGPPVKTAGDSEIMVINVELTGVATAASSESVP